ncbi:hypothetical protein ACFCZ3_20150 [Cellulosimicrobium cellulans]|uniref:hypothetical protein n=1 Tax=Cellulosimicrobium cellulans TaxID=1710 RepID=UPI0035D58B67
MSTAPAQTPAERHARFLAFDVTSALGDPSITFEVDVDGDEATATYTRGDLSATIGVTTSSTTGDGRQEPAWVVGLVDNADHTTIIDELLDASRDAATLLALVTSMVRRPVGMQMWFTLRQMDPAAAPLYVARALNETGPATVLNTLAEYDPEPAPRPFGIPVVFDVVAESREAGARALHAWLGRANKDRPAEVESRWFPEDEDRPVDGNDNDAMRLVPATPDPADVVAALDVAILALNTFEAPDATSASDFADMEDRSPSARATLNALRDSFRRA